MGIGCPEATEPNSPPSAKDFPGGWKRIPFTIQGKPKITHELNVHYPIIGGMGKDSYTLKGKMKFDNKTIKVIFTSEPQSLYTHSGEYYLINAYYFRSDMFVFFKFDDKNQHFVEIEYSSCPQGIWDLQLDNEYSDRTFKQWCLEKIYATEGFEASLAQFITYAKDKPDYLLCPANYGDNKDASRRIGSYKLFTDTGIVGRYVKDIGIKENIELKQDIYKTVLSVLNDADPNVYAMDIRDICFRLYELFPEKAKMDIEQFWKQTETENVPEDSRLKYKQWIYDYIWNQKRVF